MVQLLIQAGKKLPRLLMSKMYMLLCITVRLMTLKAGLLKDMFMRGLVAAAILIVIGAMSWIPEKPTVGM